MDEARADCSGSDHASRVALCRDRCIVGERTEVVREPEAEERAGSRGGADAFDAARRANAASRGLEIAFAQRRWCATPNVCALVN